ncbi:tetratricopeptide repeat protein [Leptolyngbya sp. PCC 6406]|uniref:tetratricopeptide repeat protein n=1 Tax=Leptolyngbya sp. PCC 6406 TaxID=1173264 RepID=UPI0002ABC223|nr:tetratricopeptide repeat protein [Leptolyngbya sp. PCC 6406]
MSAKNRLLGGRYQFIQMLGVGSGSQTLLVADLHHPGHPKCVVKQIQLPTRNPTTLRFILSLLKKKIEVLEVLGHHRQVPNTFAFFEDHQHFYLVQEFVPGRSLNHELDPGHPWQEQDVLAFLRGVLEVLVFLQEHGVIHGNLKPSNIIRHQGDRRLVLLDFSLLKELGREVSGREIVENGKLPKDWVYVPLEQRRGQPRFCTDHYALGMIALQALTGLPVEDLPDAEHPDLQQALTARLQDVSGLDPKVAGVLAGMLHPDPDRRYQKAIAVLADLNRRATSADAPQVTLDSSEVAMTAPETDIPITSPPPRHWRWALGGIALLTLVGGLLALGLPQRWSVARSLRAAQTAEQAGETETAIAHYDAALARMPQNAQALTERGMLNAQRGQSNAALADLTQALEINPKQATLFYQRGNVRFGVGDIQGALEDYTQALRLDSTLVKAYLNRGSARADWGDEQGAIQDYTQALALSTDQEVQAAAYLNRCLSYSNIDQQGQALKDCTEAINLRPSHSLAYENRGLVRRRLGDFQGSIQDYNIAIQIEPDSPDPYYNRGLTRQSLRDFPGALADFSKALDLNPEYVFARYDRGLLQAELGNTEAAIADLETAAQQCLSLGRVQCYQDAQYQVGQLRASQESSEP